MNYLCFCNMNIIYVCMICRNKRITNIIYRFISMADSGKRNYVLYGAVYNVSSEFIQYNAARLYQVWAYNNLCPREREGASGKHTHQCRSSSSRTMNKRT
jgi:hypothetical protein